MMINMKMQERVLLYVFLYVLIASLPYWLSIIDTNTALPVASVEKIFKYSFVFSDNEIRVKL